MALGNEIDLLKNYPKTKRNLDERANTKTEEDREIARKFGKDFFDGDRKHGYGGFTYQSRFWEPCMPTFIDYWKLNQDSSLLDIGCGKGFMLYDFKKAIPGIKISGIDISDYAITNSLEEIKKNLKVGNANKLEFGDNSFDVVMSINTIHNLDQNECALALQEIERVSKGGSFVTVDAYTNENEKERMEAWNLTAKTILSVEGWKSFFKEVGYTGDFFWFIP
jgi:SAM-dependent methyltransferase